MTRFLRDAVGKVVIFAHSLGSAVALDTILTLRGRNEAAAPLQSADAHMHGPVPLNKIEYLITCGSPIDKIAFFFATVGSSIRGFERMVDDLSGDIGDVPFSKAGAQPHVHWINFWDHGDPISGPLETVAPEVPRIQRVDIDNFSSVSKWQRTKQAQLEFLEKHLSQYNTARSSISSCLAMICDSATPRRDNGHEASCLS